MFLDVLPLFKITISKCVKLSKLANWEPGIDPNIHLYLLKSIFMEIIQKFRDQNGKRTHFQ